ncbi:M56 family metallopeptidase [Agromyces archimandritae]|uniref:M56 family metallopeptidase n=1 Tax=Agromyces archimandritae TaxID=2781962 RepID=A0A975FN24_9MICO|nr:M56 family metallopeptidase [Agromyces archimandritae]QTX04887.1 M56 family metallopeptidase [Agromyces archimandritae]
MTQIAAVLGVIAIALAWPAPILLARAEWPARAPATALALWQAIAVAGGLSMLGSLLAFALSAAGTGLGGLLTLGPELWAGPIPEGFGVFHLAALTLAVVLGGHLLLNLATTAVAAERQRRRQHRLLGLLSDPLPGPGRARVLAHPAPVAYCVPGMRTATVLTDGLVALLEPRELAAVIAHERMHLTGLHHLILLAFRAWHGALPWFPIANRAERAVTLLTEYLADDAAARRVGAATIRQALARVGADGEPGAYSEHGGVALDTEMLGRRLARLGDEPRTELDAGARGAIFAGSLLLVAVPTFLIALSVI